ncbi:MAG: diaminopimelate decarboxylase family protein, partial [Fidelibacterota bacterium]
YISTGLRTNKFGLDPRNALKALNISKEFRFLKVNGLHIHIGSQIESIEPFVKVANFLKDFVRKARKIVADIEFADLGGGFGINYRENRKKTGSFSFNFDELSRILNTAVKELDVKLIIEPGRAITGNSGIFITRVLYVKQNFEKKFIIVDGGMSHLIRPSLYSAFHEIKPLINYEASEDTYDIVGPICESGDFLGKDRRLPEPKPGDYLAVFDTGAYGYSLSSNYNLQFKPPEIIVEGNSFFVSRRRENYRDLLHLFQPQ